MLKTAPNPDGVPMEVFDTFRANVLADRSKYFKAFSAPFYGTNRPNSNVSQCLRDSFWLQGMQGGFNAIFDCIKAFSETDFTEFNIPTLIIHGDDDQIVPIKTSAIPTSKLIKDAILEIYSGAPHGLCSTLKDKVNKDLLTFFKE